MGLAESIEVDLHRIADALDRAFPRPRPAAVRCFLAPTPMEDAMPGQITVDTANETATILWVDDKGDTNAAPPSNASGNAVATFASDNPAVLTIATDPSNPYQGDVTPVAEGVANISATLLFPDGSAVTEADGVTAFPDPAPVAITVGPGAATGSEFSLSV